MANESDFTVGWHWTPSGYSAAINRKMEGGLDPYVKIYGLSLAQRNAAKHAAASAIYADAYSRSDAEFYGNMFEYFNYSPTTDHDRDYVNNFLGRELQSIRPNLSANEYFNFAAYLASQDLLYTPTNLLPGTSLERTQQAMKARLLKHLQVGGAETAPSAVFENIQRCFPAGTPVTLADDSTLPIEAIAAGKSEVASFDTACGFGRGGLEGKPVTRLYENVTTEWLVFAANEDWPNKTQRHTA